MANDYLGSYAQQYVAFSVLQSVSAPLGANFQSWQIYISDSDAAANFIGTPPAIGTQTTVTSSTYTTIVEGTLLDWLSEFFANNQIQEVFLVIYDHSVSSYGGLTTQFNTYKAYAYFKSILSSVQAAIGALAILCDNDPLSQVVIGTDDTNCLDSSSSSSLAHYLNTTAEVSNYWLEFNETAANSAGCQLGLSLGFLNGTGTAVANALANKSTSTIDASGAAGVNLTATQVSNLIDQNIGYWSTVGNNTGAVVKYGALTGSGGTYLAANWFVKYVEYMCSALGSQYLNDPTANRFRNNDTYQGLLTILDSIVRPFQTIGAISNFKITAPKFSDLPNTGATITVPNAWRADWDPSVTKVTVQGTLYVVVS